MPRVHRVKRARKNHGVCSFYGCHNLLVPGQSYIWWKNRYAPKRVRCTLHPPRRSDLTTSDKLAMLYAAAESVEDELGRSDTTVDRIAEVLQEAADTAQDVGGDYEASADAVDEYFPGSQQVEDIREKAYACDEWSGRLSDIAQQIESERDDLTVNDARDLAGDVVDELEL